MSMGTKEAAEALGISQTTLKRWVALFPDRFPKDRRGHYQFADREITLLHRIQSETRSGVPLEEIRLPATPPPASEFSRESTLESMLDSSMESRSESRPGWSMESDRASDSVLLRLGQLERMLDRKADEVVSAQVLQHRQEIDELRLSVQRIADSFETMMRQAAAGRETAPLHLPAPPAPAAGARSDRKPRRKFFRLFF